MQRYYLAMKRVHEALLLITIPILLLIFSSLWINPALFPIHRRLVCQAAAQLHGEREVLKQQRLIGWIFEIKCLSVNHRFHAMKTESKMFRVEATWHQNGNYFLQSIEVIAYQKPICSSLTGANSHAQVKLTFRFLLSLMYGLNALNYLNVMADCCSKYHKTATTFLHLLFLTTCGRLWCTRYCCSFPRKTSRRVSSHIQNGPPTTPFPPPPGRRFGDFLAVTVTPPETLKFDGIMYQILAGGLWKCWPGRRHIWNTQFAGRQRGA